MEYEYRPVRRVNGGEWDQIHTNRGAGRAYLTPGGARAVITRQKRADKHSVTHGKAYLERIAPDHPYRDSWERQANAVHEYKIQRRPFGEWEDFE